MNKPENNKITLRKIKKPPKNQDDKENDYQCPKKLAKDNFFQKQDSQSPLEINSSDIFEKKETSKSDIKSQQTEDQSIMPGKNISNLSDEENSMDDILGIEKTDSGFISYSHSSDESYDNFDVTLDLNMVNKVQQLKKIKQNVLENGQFQISEASSSEEVSNASDDDDFIPRTKDNKKNTQHEQVKNADFTDAKKTNKFKQMMLNKVINMKKPGKSESSEDDENDNESPNVSNNYSYTKKNTLFKSKNSLRYSKQNTTMSQKKKNQQQHFEDLKDLVDDVISDGEDDDEEEKPKKTSLMVKFKGIFGLKKKLSMKKKMPSKSAFESDDQDRIGVLTKFRSIVMKQNKIKKNNSFANSKAGLDNAQKNFNNEEKQEIDDFFSESFSMNKESYYECISQHFGEEDEAGNELAQEEEEEEMNQTPSMSKFDAEYYQIMNNSIYLKKKIGGRIFVFLPTNVFKKWWDVLQSLLILYISVFFPYEIAFHNYDHGADYDSFEFIFNKFIELLFFFDMIFCFFTSYIDGNDYQIIEKSKIACNYIKFWFWIDLISIMPLDLMDSNNSNNLFVMIRLFRITKFFKQVIMALKSDKMMKYKYSDNMLGYIYRSIMFVPGFERQIVLVIAIFLGCHNIACITYYFSYQLSYDDNLYANRTMIRANISLDDSNWSKYLYMLYWVIQTMTTVGYGDISNYVSDEQLWAILIMIIGVIFFSITISNQNSMLLIKDTMQVNYERDRRILDMINEKHKLPKNLFDQIDKLLKKNYETNCAESETFNQFLDELPKLIRMDLSYVLYKSQFVDQEFFFDKPKNLIAEVGPKLRFTYFSKGEMIINQNEPALDIFFIFDGKVAMIIPEYDNFPFITISKGHYFGETDILNEENRKNSILALTDCTLQALDKYEFNRIFYKEFPSIGGNLYHSTKKRQNRQEKAYDLALGFCKDNQNHKAQDARVLTNDLGKFIRTKKEKIGHNNLAEGKNDRSSYKRSTTLAIKVLFFSL